MTSVGLGGAFDSGAFDGGGFNTGSTPTLVVGQGAIAPVVSVPLGGLAMTSAAGALPYTFKQSLGGLQLTAGRGSVTATIPMSIAGFPLGLGLGALPLVQILNALTSAAMGISAGVITEGTTPDVDLSTTLHTLVVPYEERTIRLLPEQSLLGIPAEEFVMYVSRDSRAREVH